jgi:hypothetical protein
MSNNQQVPASGSTTPVQVSNSLDIERFQDFRVLHEDSSDVILRETRALVRAWKSSRMSILGKWLLRDSPCVNHLSQLF